MNDNLDAGAIRPFPLLPDRIAELLDENARLREALEGLHEFVMRRLHHRRWYESEPMCAARRALDPSGEPSDA